MEKNCSRQTPLKIDLDAILRQRIGDRKSRFIPRFATAALERLVHQNELNATLEATFPTEGSEFAARVYNHFSLTLNVEGLENIPPEGRFIFASNHPLGGLDGIGLIKVLGAKYGDENIRFLVNDMLMNVEPLRSVFLPINKFGAQGRAAARLISEAYQSHRQIIIFPAGLVSRLSDDGKIADLEWQKSFILKAVEHKRDIIPIRFVGKNRMRFYRTARIRSSFGLKFNIEQTMLPAELCAARGKTFSVKILKPISWQHLEERLQAGESPKKIAAEIRSLVN